MPGIPYPWIHPCVVVVIVGHNLVNYSTPRDLYIIFSKINI